MTHMKLLQMPRAWNIKKTGKKFITRAKPGSHNKNTSMPIGVILRNILNLTKSNMESKKLMSRGEVFVDGSIVKSVAFPVGFMDILTIKGINKNYRIIFDRKGRLTPIEISDDANIRMVTVANKTALRNGRMQLNLSNGYNILVAKEDADKYPTKGTLIITVPELKIKKYLPFEKGMKVLVIAGTHIGEIAEIIDMKPFIGPQPDRVFLKNEAGETYDTLEDYAFIIGKTKSEVKII